MATRWRVFSNDLHVWWFKAVELVSIQRLETAYQNTQPRIDISENVREIEDLDALVIEMASLVNASPGP